MSKKLIAALSLSLVLAACNTSADVTTGDESMMDDETVVDESMTDDSMMDESMTDDSMDNGTGAMMQSSSSSSDLEVEGETTIEVQ